MTESPISGREDRPSRHQRGDPRDSMLLQATLRLSEAAAPVAIRIRNLSAGGLMADCALPLASGQAVEVELRNIGAVIGQVAWADGQRIGIAFDGPIDPQLTRRPVGTKRTGTMIVSPPTLKSRRPGLRTE